jgi:hypothetical protein
MSCNTNSSKTDGGAAEVPEFMTKTWAIWLYIAAVSTAGLIVQLVADR